MKEQMKRDRDALLISLESVDEKEIDRYYKTWGLEKPSKNIYILAGLHKARMYVKHPFITKEMVELSKQWLKNNGFKEPIKDLTPPKKGHYYNLCQKKSLNDSV